MEISKKDLIEMFDQLGFKSTRTWSPSKLADRLHRLHELNPKKGDTLTEDARKTFFTCQAVAFASALNWADPVTVSERTTEKTKRRHRTKLHACVAIDFRRAEGRVLHDWLKKYGYRDPKEDWNKMTRTEKTEVTEEACGRIILAWVHGEVE